MRFFKYLVLLVLSILSISVSAATTYALTDVSSYPKLQTLTSSTKESLCSQTYSVYLANYKNPYSTYGSSRVVSDRCTIFQADGSGEIAFGFRTIVEETKCLEAGYPNFHYFASNTPIPTQICKPNSDGTYCIFNYGGETSPKNPLVITQQGRQQIILNSVSSIPSPTCTPHFSKTSCDSNDPYGGCYQPPDDGCNRMADGSLYCPSDVPEPPVSNTCNGATYCDRPPQGCGKGYVSGSFNGKQICIKTSPSTGNPPTNDGDSGNTGEGTGTSTTTGTETTTTTTTNSDGSTSTSTSTTTTNNTTVNNFKIDLSGVIAAVNAVSAQVSSLKNELLISISNLSSKLDSTNSKLDSTNSKLDTTNSKLTDLNSSSLRQEQLLKDIRDKTVSDGGSDQPASGASTDLTETNGILNDIKDALTKEPDLSPLKADLPTGELTQQSLKTDIFGSTAQCPADRVLNLPLLTKTYNDTFSYQLLCTNLAIVGFLIMIAAYAFAAYIVSKA